MRLGRTWKCEVCGKKGPGKVSRVTGKKLCASCWAKQPDKPNGYQYQVKK